MKYLTYEQTYERMQSVIEGVTEELNSLKFLNDYNNELDDRISELQEEINESLDESQIDEILEYIENETIKVDEELERWLEKFRYANGEEKNLGLDAEEITEYLNFIRDRDNKEEAIILLRELIEGPEQEQYRNLKNFVDFLNQELQDDYENAPETLEIKQIKLLCLINDSIIGIGATDIFHLDGNKKVDENQHALYLAFKSVSEDIAPEDFEPIYMEVMKNITNPYTKIGMNLEYLSKTEDYMLSCAQNYRKGRGNFQQHIWQASLGGRAIVFATHPGSGEYNGRPNYFVGNGCMPKATAYKNVLISIHRIPADDPHGLCTHAYFPQREFDEVVMKNGWIIGRKDDGYAALYSLKKGWWNDKNPELFRSIYKTNWEAEYERALPYDYWVPGHANVWICELGSRKEYGSFEKFVEAVSKAKVEGDTFSIRYQSPSLGLVTSGWDEPFVVDGQEIQVDHYKRYDNPYCQAEFDTDQYVISYHGKTMTVDFKDKEII